MGDKHCFQGSFEPKQYTHPSLLIFHQFIILGSKHKVLLGSKHLCVRHFICIGLYNVTYYYKKKTLHLVASPTVLVLKAERKYDNIGPLEMKVKALYTKGALLFLIPRKINFMVG